MGLAEIEARIGAACQAVGRRRQDVTLIAVSKLQPPARVQAVLQAGHRVFGENYVQEAQGKWPDWRAQFPGVALHMIGPLQGNKAGPAMDLFDAIHTLDRLSLAERLARLAQARGRCPDLFVQVNTGAEPQKGGVLPQACEALVRQARALGLAPRGLMCIPPEGQDPLPHFRLLRSLAHQSGLADLSMGMSGDFEAAIAEGASHIRIGSAIFGARA